MEEDLQLISLILSIIIKLLNFIITFILTMVLSVFPNFDFKNFGEIYTAFFGILKNAGNLLYFCSGNLMFIWADIILTLFTTKHIILPIVNLIRKDLLRG